jgi:hypothetical protein
MAKTPTNKTKGPIPQHHMLATTGKPRPDNARKGPLPPK